MTIYYVRPTNGDDADTGLSFALAKKTLSSAYSAASDGDEIRLCNEAAESVSANLSLTKSIDLIGADTTDGSPLDGSGVYELNYSGLGASTDAFTFGTAGKTVKAADVYFNGATGGQYGFYALFDPYFLKMIRCRVSNFGSHGFYWLTTGGLVTLTDCEIDNNGGSGFDVNAAGRGNLIMTGGSAHDNTTHGIRSGGDDSQCAIHSVRVYDNGSDGINTLAADAIIRDCTVYGNGGDGVDIDGSNTTIFDTSSAGNGGYGFNGVTNLAFGGFDNNHTNGNTSGAGDSTLPGDNNVTGDPKFTSVTDGSEDFTPLSGSPLIGAGINGSNIGAVAHGDSSGGTLVISGVSPHLRR